MASSDRHHSPGIVENGANSIACAEAFVRPDAGATMAMNASQSGLKRTPLHDLHLAMEARMAPFAGYELPIQYPLGVLKEHLHTRAAAGLFDVSHMGQIALRPRQGNLVDIAFGLERLVP